MRVNETFCKDIINVWEYALCDGCTKEEAIEVLNETFRGQHMSTADVQFLYQIHRDARYFECGVTTLITLDN